MSWRIVKRIGLPVAIAGVGATVDNGLLDGATGEAVVGLLGALFRLFG